jgi:hypothetical protein
VWLDTFEEHIKSGDIMNVDNGIILKELIEQIIVNDNIEIYLKYGVVIEKETLALGGRNVPAAEGFYMSQNCDTYER